MINSPYFYCKNKDTYPPFKNGLIFGRIFLKIHLIIIHNTQENIFLLYGQTFKLNGGFNKKTRNAE